MRSSINTSRRSLRRSIGLLLRTWQRTRLRREMLSFGIRRSQGSTSLWKDITINTTLLNKSLHLGVDGREMPSMAYRTVQLSETLDCGGFDDGFIEGHQLVDFERRLGFGNEVIRRVIHIGLVVISKALED